MLQAVVGSCMGDQPPPRINANAGTCVFYVVYEVRWPVCGIWKLAVAAGLLNQICSPKRYRP
jgi:hypothetical protein